MKSSLISIAAFLCFCTVLATADTIYENGPVSGDYVGWRFDGPPSTSNSFTVSGGNSTIDGMSFWVVIFVTDHNPEAEVIISSQSNGGGTVYFDQTVQFSTETNCYANYWGLNLCQETTTWTGGPTLPNGTYWVTLRHGTVPSGGYLGWDQNAGYDCHSAGCPSQAFETFEGTIPSEAFTIMGTSGGSKPSTPKTTSLLLFGSGFVGVLGMVRRKLG